MKVNLILMMMIYTNKLRIVKHYKIILAGSKQINTKI